MNIKSYIEYIKESDDKSALSSRAEMLEHIELMMETCEHPAWIIQSHDRFNFLKITLLDIVKLALKYKRDDLLAYIIKNWRSYNDDFYFKTSGKRDSAHIKGEVGWILFNHKLFKNYMDTVGYLDVGMYASSVDEYWPMVEYIMNNYLKITNEAYNSFLYSALGLYYHSYSVSNIVNLFNNGYKLNYTILKHMILSIKLAEEKQQTIINRLCNAIIDVVGENSSTISNFVSDDGIKWFSENINILPKHFLDEFGWIFEMKMYENVNETNSTTLKELDASIENDDVEKLKLVLRVINYNRPLLIEKIFYTFDNKKYECFKLLIIRFGIGVFLSDLLKDKKHDFNYKKKMIYKMIDLKLHNIELYFTNLLFTAIKTDFENNPDDIFIPNDRFFFFKNNYDEIFIPDGRFFLLFLKNGAKIDDTFWPKIKSTFKKSNEINYVFKMIDKFVGDDASKFLSIIEVKDLTPIINSIPKWFLDKWEYLIEINQYNNEN